MKNIEIEYLDVSKLELTGQISRETVRRFLNDNIGYDFSETNFKWEFEDIPIESVFLIAVDNKKIIGTQSFLPWIIMVNGAKVISAKSESSFLLPPYRGHGIFETMYKKGLSLCKEKGIKVIWGFTSATKVWRESLAFDVVENNMYDFTLDFRQVTKFQKIAEAILKKIRIYRFINRLPRHVTKLIKTKKDYVIEDQVLELTSLALIEKSFITGNQNIELELSEKYIKWRILENPILNYRIMILKDKRNEIKASILYVPGEDNVIRISKIWFHSASDFRMIFNFLISWGRRYKYNSIYYFCNIENKVNYQFSEIILEKKGIICKSAWANTVIKFIGEKEKINERDILLKTQNWYFDGLWTQGFSI